MLIFTRTAGYATVCPVVWEDGGSNPASYPILQNLGYFIEFRNENRSCKSKYRFTISVWQGDGVSPRQNGKPASPWKNVDENSRPFDP